jgi:dihydrolipoamide dehydrogenase
MSEIIKVTVPDIGDFSDVEIIEVLVAAGERVDAEQPVITLESDKASMDVPAPAAGVVRTVHVAVGERVSEGSLILDLGIDARAGAADAPEGEDDDAEDSFLDIGGVGDAADAEPVVLAGEDEALAQELRCQVVVLGAGPGGYTAAFRAADLGLKTVLVERYPTLGGVCLNVGCIPSKALLHTAEVIAAARAMADHGVAFGEPTLDLPRLVGWKNSVVAQLTKGLAGLARQRKVEVVQGVGSFEDASTLRVDGDEGVTRVRFDHAIIAAGSQAVQIPGFPNDDPRLMDSTDALELDEIPGRMLVIGGGIIGLEMACVYSALGSTITVVELLDGLMPGTDRDLVRPLEKRIRSEYENIFVGTRVTGIEPTDAGLRVSFDGAKAPDSDVFDRVLVAVGRAPNGHRIGAVNAGVNVDERGFIAVDRQQRTNVAHIFAIGDIVGQPMLAHKATHEGKVAAEVAAGMKSGFDALTIPSVAYTDPEVAWCGLTESEAKEQGVDYEKGSFPWAASGRALGIGRSEGLTKVLFDAHTGRVLGADLCLTIHPHPTLSETVNFAAEIAEGTITDLYIPKKRK